MSLVPTNQYGLRFATKNDLDTLVQFNSALAWETEKRRLDLHRLRPGVQAVLDSPHRGFYVVAETKTGAQVVGQLLITFEWSDWRNGVMWWIQSAYVREDCRRQGVFRMLYQHVLQEADTENAVAGVRLYVEQDNLVAQRTYESLGLAKAPYQVYERDFVLFDKSE